jgi:hypothetical protein
MAHSGALATGGARCSGDFSVEPLGHGTLGGLLYDVGRIWSTESVKGTRRYADASKVIGADARRVLQRTGRVTCRDPATDAVVREFGAGDVLDCQTFTKDVDADPSMSLHARADGVDVCDDRLPDGGGRKLGGYVTVRDFETVIPSDRAMRFATGHASGVVRVYNGNERRAVCVSHAIGGLHAFDGRHAAAIDAAGRLTLFDWATRTTTPVGAGAEGYEGAALARDLLIAWRGRKLTCWRLHDPEDLRGGGRSSTLARPVVRVVTDPEACRSEGGIDAAFLVVMDDMSAEPFRAR